MKQLPPAFEYLPPVPQWNACECDLCAEVKREAQRAANLGLRGIEVVLRVHVTITPPERPALAKPLQKSTP